MRDEPVTRENALADSSARDRGLRWAGDRSTEQELQDAGGYWWPKLHHIRKPSPTGGALRGGRVPFAGRQHYQEGHERNCAMEAEEDRAQRAAYDEHDS
jgi:hypothetical protein